MSVPQLPMVRVTRSLFDEWLRSGVYWLRNMDSVPADDDIWVRLLPKFGGWRDSDLPVAALIDEVVAITLKTPELTDELAIRLRNLGEDWLPFGYSTHPDGPANTPEDSQPEHIPLRASALEGGRGHSTAGP